MLKYYGNDVGVMIKYACILICRIQQIVDDDVVCLHEIWYVIIVSGWWCGNLLVDDDVSSSYVKI